MINWQLDYMLFRYQAQQVSVWINCDPDLWCEHLFPLRRQHCVWSSNVGRCTFQVFRFVRWSCQERCDSGRSLLNVFGTCMDIAYIMEAYMPLPSWDLSLLLKHWRYPSCTKPLICVVMIDTWSIICSQVSVCVMRASLERIVLAMATLKSPIQPPSCVTPVLRTVVGSLWPGVLQMSAPYSANCRCMRYEFISVRPAKLPWIFMRAPLIFNGAPRTEIG